MTYLTPEMIEQAKAANTVEELLTLAKENNIEMTEESAKAYFAQLNPKSGELDEDLLVNVSGGWIIMDESAKKRRGKQEKKRMQVNAKCRIKDINYDKYKRRNDQKGKDGKICR